MLTSETVLFRRADKFEDRLEGATPAQNRAIRAEAEDNRLHPLDEQIKFDERLIHIFAAREPSEMRTNMLLGLSERLVENRRVASDPTLRAKYDEQRDQFREDWFDAKSLKHPEEIFEHMREHTFISCWHLNPDESAAMWQSYASFDAGLAIQTTVGRLRQQLDQAAEHYVLGPVRYVDYNDGALSDADSYVRFFHKEMSFSHEQEFRCIWRNPAHVPWERRPAVAEIGLPIPFQMRELIEAVYVSPNAKPYFAEMLEKLLKQLGFHLKPTPSKLSLKPYF